MTTFELLTGLSVAEANRPHHAVAFAVSEYCMEIEDDPAVELIMKRLSNRLRVSALEIDSGEPASEEMDLLLPAVFGRDHEALTARLREIVDEMVSRLMQDKDSALATR